MKLAFNNTGHYTDFSDGYELYVKRSKTGNYVSPEIYNRIIRRYCKRLADRLLKYGIVDLPAGLGSIAAAELTRRPQFRGKKFIGYGKLDWKTGQYDGKLKTFGLVFLPRRDRNQNLRSFGYVANRKLYKRIKQEYESGESSWGLLEFNNDMI